MIIYKIEQAGTGHVYARPETYSWDESGGFADNALLLFSFLKLSIKNVGRYCYEVVP